MRFCMKASLFSVKLLLVLSVLFLVGCSSGKIVKSYEGEELTVEQLAVLTAPENIVVLSINGKKVKRYLLSDLNVRYGLKPGKNIIVFQHESVWAKAIREEQDAPRSVKVTSEPKEVLLNVKAGEKLTFSFKNGANIREAKILAKAFQADVVDSGLNIVAQSAALGTYQETSNGKLSAEKITQSLAGTAELQTLDALKVLWETATTNEKKAFLAWAFQK